MSGTQMGLGLFIDDKAIDRERERQIRPKRHVRRPGGGLACGHQPLPHDGRYVQYPLSFKALLSVTDCASCRAYLTKKAADKVVESVNQG